MPLPPLRRLALAVRDRARASWREAVGTDGVDEDTMLFVHHRALFRHALEIVALLALVALCGFVSFEPLMARFEHLFPIFKMGGMSHFHPIDSRSFDQSFVIWSMRRGTVVLPLLLMATGMVVLMRVLRTPLLLGLALVLWPVASMAALARVYTLPLWCELALDGPSGLVQQLVPVPFFFAALPPFALVLAAVAGGVYAARRRFSLPRTAAGAVAAAIAMHLLVYRDLSTVATVHGIAALALLVCTALAFVSLPGQRRAVALFAGCDWSQAESDARRPRSLGDALGVHVALAAVGLLSIAAVLVAWVHAAIMQRTHTPAPRTTRPPDMVNAREFLGADFARGPVRWKVDGPGLWRQVLRPVEPVFPDPTPSERWAEDDVLELMPLASFLAREDAALYKATITREREDAAFASLEPHLSQLVEAARRADYFEPLDANGERMSMWFPTFRTLVRCLGARASLRAHRGDVDGALADIEAIFGTAALFSASDADIVHRMMSCAFRSIGTSAFESCLEAWRDDPASLASLAAAMEALEARATRPMDTEGWMKEELGEHLIAYPFEIATPGFVKARNTWDANRDQYRRARIAVAIARFRLDRGAWPNSIDQLKPDYLAREPRSPFTGWRYVLLGDGASPPEIRVVRPGGGDIYPLESYPVPKPSPWLGKELTKRAKAAATQ